MVNRSLRKMEKSKFHGNITILLKCIFQVLAGYFRVSIWLLVNWTYGTGAGYVKVVALNSVNNNQNSKCIREERAVQHRLKLQVGGSLNLNWWGGRRKGFHNLN